MPFPAGVTTRQLRFGNAFANPDGGALGMRVTFTPNRNLVWAATGDPGVMRSFKAVAGLGQTGTISPPVTDQAGWRVPGGGVLSVAGGLQAFLYDVSVEFLDEVGNAIEKLDVFEYALLTGDGSPIDLDLALPFTGDDGHQVSIVDVWSAQIAAAQAAAAAAAASAQSLTIAGTVTS
jgi:hypothetical protein